MREPDTKPQPTKVSPDPALSRVLHSFLISEWVGPTASTRRSRMCGEPGVAAPSLARPPTSLLQSRAVFAFLSCQFDDSRQRRVRPIRSLARRNAIT